MLLGYPTDDENVYNTYNGTPCVTLTNNYYRDTVTKAPALMRYDYYHSLNNYVYNFSMGYTVHSACDSKSSTENLATFTAAADLTLLKRLLLG